MKKRSGLRLASVAMGAWATMAMGQPLLLDWGTIDTSSDDAQAMFRLVKSSAAAPVVQRLSARGTAPWLVQFSGGIREEWKTALESAGASIQGYVPENALLVDATPEAFARIASMDDVVWAGEYLPAYKKSKAVREGSASGAEESREYQVELFDIADKAQVVRDLGELGATVMRSEAFSDRAGFRAWLTPKQVGEAANWGAVVWIEPHLQPRSWGASLPDPESDEASSPEAASLQQAFDAGERVACLRRGVADAGNSGAEAAAVDWFVWEHPEMLVVAAAGNAAVDLNPADGIVDAGSVGTPATAKNVLAVGAAEGRLDVGRVWRDSWPEDFAVQPIAMDPMAQADGPQGLAAFSGRGPCADGRIKPDLVAPGTFVAVSRAPDSDFTGWGVAADTNEIYVGGTGVAAEQVAAAAKQARRWLAESRGIPFPSAALVKALLVAGARDLAPGQYGTGPKREIPDVRPNSAQGFGWLDVERSLQAGEGESLDWHDGKKLAVGAMDVYELNAGRAGGHFVLVLAYSDYPAVPAAGRQRVNDLDLSVTTPSGAVVHPNGRGTPDDLNNVEMIEFEADEAGTYLARVEARAVPMGGSQPYALVVRGPQSSAAPAAVPSETP